MVFDLKLYGVEWLKARYQLGESIEQKCAPTDFVSGSCPVIEYKRAELTVQSQGVKFLLDKLSNIW